MDREEAQRHRRELKAQYKELFDHVNEILFRHDPIGINYESNTDEYEPEVGTILPRLREARSPDDLRRIVHQEFLKWFGDMADPEERYTLIAEEIWQVYRQIQS
jgi:hypothetical protein